MKRKLIVLLACLLAIAMVFSACESAPGSSGSSDVSTGTQETSGSADSSPQAEEVGENWVDDEVVHLKFWAMREDTVQDMETNAYIQWIEQECGVDIEFEQASSAEALQKLNLSLASGDYPDVYYSLQTITDINTNIINSTLMKYGEAGIFIPLNDLIDQYGENIGELLDSVDYLAMVLQCRMGIFTPCQHIRRFTTAVIPRKCGLISLGWMPWILRCLPRRTSSTRF